MPFNLGPGELFLIAVAALLIFGPTKLPEIGRSLGEAIGSLKKAYNGALKLEDETQPPRVNAESNAPTATQSGQSESNLATNATSEQALIAATNNTSDKPVPGAPANVPARATSMGTETSADSATRTN
ncbi:MAG: twin-arginine translocase TatA/TatE family subunit [bacterium]|nr:twin-arginine translocase TatA/TatE family subunit [bacterium]